MTRGMPESERQRWRFTGEDLADATRHSGEAAETIRHVGRGLVALTDEIEYQMREVAALRREIESPRRRVSWLPSMAQGFMMFAFWSGLDAIFVAVRGPETVERKLVSAVMLTLFAVLAWAAHLLPAVRWRRR